MSKTGLTSKELYKDGREFRVDLFLKKYKEGIPFEMVSGPEQILVFEQRLYDLVKSKSNLTGVLFKTESGLSIVTGKLAKSKEFGGGSGSGAGAAATDINESAQAVYMQAFSSKYTINRANKEDIGFNDDELRKAHSLDLVKSQIDPILKLNDEWVKSSELITMKFFSESADLAGNKSWTFYHDKGFVPLLNEAYIKLNKLNGRFFTNMNKWNPSDIWALSIPLSEASEKINNCGSLVQLNSLIYTWLRDRKVIGISLKKVVSKPTVQFYNYRGASDLLKQAKLTKVITSATSFFNSKDMYIHFNNGSIQYHNFGSGTVQGQISGSSAFGGKVGHGPIISILKLLKINDTYDIRKKYVVKYNELKTIISNRHSKVSTHIESYKKLTDFLYTEYKLTNGQLTNEKFLIELEQKNKKDGFWIFSKTVTLSLKNILKDAGPDRTQDFLYYSLSYAGSESLTSSAFIKIS